MRVLVKIRAVCERLPQQGTRRLITKALSERDERLLPRLLKRYLLRARFAPALSVLFCVFLSVTR
jgi:hypothetical protein